MHAPDICKLSLTMAFCQDGGAKVKDCKCGARSRSGEHREAQEGGGEDPIIRTLGFLCLWVEGWGWRVCVCGGGGGAIQVKNTRDSGRST